MTRRLLTTAIAAALALTTACGGGDTDGAAPAVADTADDVARTASDDDTAATDDTAETAEDTAPPAPEALPPVIDGLEPIVLLTPASGGGERPLLEWEPVSGAEIYLIVVYDADGTATWSTITDATSIHLGGPLAIPDANSGPRIGAGSSWVVYADDIDGRIIAASGRAPISP